LLVVVFRLGVWEEKNGGGVGGPPPQEGEAGRSWGFPARATAVFYPFTPRINPFSIAKRYMRASKSKFLHLGDRGCQGAILLSKAEA
jgi:hypothetical protein